MSIESPTPEKPFERILTHQEAHELMRHLVKGEFKVLNSREDEAGLYYLNVEVAGEQPGETTEYMYIRKTPDKEPSTTVTTVVVAFYEDDMPVGGNTVADYINNEWIMQ